MTQTAKVLEKNEDKMTVEVVRNGACSKNCASCKGCSGGQKKIIIDIPHDGKAEKGDIIDIEVETGKVLGLSGLTYIVPIFCFIIGNYFGAKVSENVGILCAFIGLCLPVPFLILLNKKVKENFFNNIKTKL